MAERSSNLIRLAQNEAARLGHEYVATEHLMLALTAVTERPAGRALASRGISHDALLASVQQLVQPGLGEVPTGKLPCTPYAKRAIERAIEEARGFGHQTVEPEHLLLAVIADEQSVAVSALLRLGVSPKSLRDAVLKETGWNGAESM